MGVLMFGYLVLAFACLSIGYLGRLLWKQHKNNLVTKRVGTRLVEHDDVPDILMKGELPQTRMHHDSGPHPSCDCRVCVLQRRNFELELTIDKLRHFKRV